MTIRVRSPLADINEAPRGKTVRGLAALEGRRMGLLWGQHASSVKFWPVFEKVAEARFRPSEIHRVYKASTWNVAPAEDIEALAGKVDYVVVGVGG
ncbi:MAG: hypothetical protein HYR51_02095 [Candidatus Rokubacteria bacterium]|nr:hypothetical protein [Candidatus Rokubacteria bacterium]